MKTPFPRTSRWMQDDQSPLPWSALVLLGVVLMAWGAWFFLGRVRVYAVTQVARTEVDKMAHGVHAPVVGVVSENWLELGKRVRRGEVLLSLDSTAEQLQKVQEEARLKGHLRALAVLEKQLEAEHDAQNALAMSLGAATQAAAAKGKVARAMQEQASQEDALVKQLHSNALATGQEALKSASEAKRQQAEALAAQIEIGRVVAGGRAELKDREVQRTRLEHSIALLQSEIELSKAAIARFEFEIERRRLRAVVDGTVADLSMAPTGSLLAQGQKIAVIVPEGGTRLIAHFSPAEAVGRVKPGQLAIVRMDAFPWTENGVVKARVEQVAREPQDGQIRTELSFEAGELRLPLGHGMTGSVEVELEETAPFRLLLRTAGQLTVGPTPAVSTKPSTPSASLQ